MKGCHFCIFFLNPSQIFFVGHYVLFGVASQKLCNNGFWVFSLWHLADVFLCNNENFFLCNHSLILIDILSRLFNHARNLDIISPSILFNSISFKSALREFSCATSLFGGSVIFLLLNIIYTEKALIGISCKFSLEAKLGKACCHSQYHQISSGAFCHPRHRIRLRQKQSSADQEFHNPSLFNKFSTFL